MNITLEKIAFIRGLLAKKKDGESEMLNVTLIRGLLDLAESALWRTDWENAPQDQTPIIISTLHHGHRFEVMAEWAQAHQGWLDTRSESSIGVLLKSTASSFFRPITPPEGE